MPAKDPINHKANEWMIREGLVASEPKRPAKEQRPSRRVMSAQVQRLAKRLEKDPDELAKGIPEDTLRRSKYPVIEQVDEQGRRFFKHDPGIEEGRRALIPR